MAAKSEPKAKVKTDLKTSLKCEKPAVIILRLFEVIASWQDTAVEFIKYTRENMLTYLQDNWKKKYLMQLIEELRQQSYNDKQTYGDSPVVFKARQTSMAIQQSCIYYLSWRLTVDGGFDVGQEGQAHNTLQKFLWYDGIVKNKLVITIYPEVAAAIKKWKQAGVKVCLYSSCTSEEIESGKKLISYTNCGNLSDLFDVYLDTQVHTPARTESYAKIAKDLNVAPKQVLLLSRSVTETENSSKAGVKAILVIREDGIAAFSSENLKALRAIGKLDEITF